MNQPKLVRVVYHFDQGTVEMSREANSLTTWNVIAKPTKGVAKGWTTSCRQVSSTLAAVFLTRAMQPQTILP